MCASGGVHLTGGDVTNPSRQVIVGYLLLQSPVSAELDGWSCGRCAQQRSTLVKLLAKRG